MTYSLRYVAPMYTAPLTGLPSTHPAIVDPLGDRAAWGALLGARESDGLLPAASIPGALVSTLAASLVGRSVLAPVSTSPGARWGLFVVALDGASALAKLPTGEAWSFDASTPAALIVDRAADVDTLRPDVLAVSRFVLAGESVDGSAWWSRAAPNEDGADASMIARRAPSLRTAALSTLGALAPTNMADAPRVLVKVSETRWRVVRW